MKVFEMNDCDWWLANSAEEALADIRGVSPSASDAPPEIAPRELTDEELDRLIFSDDLSEPNAAKRTFREELNRRIAAGVTTPEPFASTEY
jgi:hypothetical protein